LKIIAQREERVDKFLQSHLKEPRNQVENLIKKHGVTVNGKEIKKCGFKLKEGDVIEYTLPRQEKKSIFTDVDLDIDIIYEDEDILIVNKPPFLTVHQAPSVKEPTLVDWLKLKGVSLSTLSGEERHGIVHRIDKETSGALVIAKNNQAHQALSNQLQNRTMGRYYLSIITPPLKEDTIIEKAIARDRNNRVRMSVADRGGREAKSAFIKLLPSKDEKKELISAKLFTGRTHQIRVHLKSISRAILGDTLYGFKSKKGNISRVMLHAYIIYFHHPISGEMIIKKAPLFDDFKELLYSEFKKEEIDEKLDFNYIINRFNDIF
jgi:23S rRNA pseudouridine1911/1915/1917 synthase